MPVEFIDTNILVYAFDASAGKKRDAASLLMSRLLAEDSAGISIQVLQELYVTLTRKIPKTLGSKKVEGIVRDLASLTVHEPKRHDVLEAIRIARRYRISFWDAMVVRSAVSLEAGILWSEDLQSGQTYAGVKVESPFLRNRGQS